jgi:hypothetical protein
VPWRTRLSSIVMLFALTTLPIAGVLCTALCSPDVRVNGQLASAHHGAEGECETGGTAPVRLKTLVAHDCRHEGAPSEPAPAVASTRGPGAHVPLSPVAFVQCSAPEVATFAPALAYSPPHDRVPTSGIGRVLRI